MTGHLLFKLNNSALGAIITHGLVNEEGTFTVAAESGDVLYWDMKTRKVVFQEKQPNIEQLFFYKEHLQKNTSMICNVFFAIELIFSSINNLFGYIFICFLRLW